jgi:hypothetical protein
MTAWAKYNSPDYKTLIYTQINCNIYQFSCEVVAQDLLAYAGLAQWRENPHVYCQNVVRNRHKCRARRPCEVRT